MGNGWETPGREEVITGQFTGKKTLLYQLVLGGDHLQVQQHADENCSGASREVKDCPQIGSHLF